MLAPKTHHILTLFATLTLAACSIDANQIIDPKDTGLDTLETPDVTYVDDSLPDTRTDNTDTGSPNVPPPDMPDLNPPDMDPPDMDPPDMSDTPDLPDMPDPPPWPSGTSLLQDDAQRGENSSDEDVPPARIWRTSTNSPGCGEVSFIEDFSSGSYNVHRYRTSWNNRGPIILELERTAGLWQPAIVIANDEGDIIFAGEGPGDATNILIDTLETGRQGDRVHIQLLPSMDTGLYLYVSSWEALDNNLAVDITQEARYRLSQRQECPPPEGLNAHHAGLTLDGAEIPRQGLDNRTLENALGVNPEPHGDVVTFQGLDFVRGAVSWFGGPRDTGVSPTETGAISGEVLRSLHDPEDPSDAILAERPEDYYFVAMRFNYSPQGRSFWQNARFLVVNPDTGAAIVVRAVDWGPHTRTSRILDLSLQSLRDLGLDTDEDALVSFAPVGTPLGPIRL